MAISLEGCEVTFRGLLIIATRPPRLAIALERSAMVDKAAADVQNKQLVSTTSKRWKVRFSYSLWKQIVDCAALCC